MELCSFKGARRISCAFVLEREKAARRCCAAFQYGRPAANRPLRNGAAQFCAAGARGEPITVYGTGQQSRCFCDVRDCVEAIMRLVATEAAIGEVVNIGNTGEITIEKLADLVKQRTNSVLRLLLFRTTRLMSRDLKICRAVCLRSESSSGLPASVPPHLWWKLSTGLSRTSGKRKSRFCRKTLMPAPMSTRKMSLSSGLRRKIAVNPRAWQSVQIFPLKTP